MNNNLLNLFEFCGKHKINFIYETKGFGNNTIEYNEKEEKKVIVRIYDPEDKDLNNLIGGKLKKLEETFHQSSTN